jgi:hypothetical protein
MKSNMDVDSTPVIPTLIEEVPNFKSFVETYISKDILIGHTKGRQFLFYRRANGDPLTQYKLRCTNEIWLPEEGIQLWEVDMTGRAKLPIGVPASMMIRPIKGHVEIVKGISGVMKINSS